MKAFLRLAILGVAFASTLSFTASAQEVYVPNDQLIGDADRTMSDASPDEKAVESHPQLIDLDATCGPHHTLQQTGAIIASQGK